LIGEIIGRRRSLAKMVLPTDSIGLREPLRHLVVDLLGAFEPKLV
jgi:hypothetical protein